MSATREFESEVSGATPHRYPVSAPHTITYGVMSAAEDGSTACPSEFSFASLPVASVRSAPAGKPSDPHLQSL